MVCLFLSYFLQKYENYLDYHQFSHFFFFFSSFLYTFVPQNEN